MLITVTINMECSLPKYVYNPPGYMVDVSDFIYNTHIHIHVPDIPMKGMLYMEYMYVVIQTFQFGSLDHAY